MIVLKFGGTSMGSATRMRDVSQLIQRDEPCIVILSAMAGVTDSLVESVNYFRIGKQDKGSYTLRLIQDKFEQAAYEFFSGRDALADIQDYLAITFDELIRLIAENISAEAINKVIASGEMITSRIFYRYLLECGISAILLDAVDFMRLDDHWEPDLPAISELLLPKLNSGSEKLYITQGFVCRNQYGEVDNLKRGGSDYSATLIGAAVKANMIEIWTDIDGLQNNDPREVDDTFAIRNLSFDEAAELAYFGAKILHPACVWPARQCNIPIWLRNTMQPDNQGTLIGKATKSQGITAIAAKDGITAIRIKSGSMLNTYGFLVDVFKVFKDFQTPIDMITTSEVSVSLTIDNDANLAKIVDELKKLGTVEVDRDQSIICIVGDFLADKNGHVARIVHSLHNIPVRMISYGGSQNNISLLVAHQEKKNALNRLNSGLFQLGNIPGYSYS